jgi:polar amino acid transport system substrate-binding protein
MEEAGQIGDAYAPTGILRVALNFGNRVLVGRDTQGRPKGISVDLARALADTIERPPHFIEFERAVDVSASADQDLWDICFLAIDPARADTIAFTAPYVRISGSYLSGGVAVRGAEEVVERGLRVGVVEGSAYSLYLARRPGAEHLAVYPDIVSAIAALEAGEVEVLAGIEQAMQAEADRHDGWRVLHPPFMQIEQAMGVPAGRAEAARHLHGFVAQLARSGGIGGILERHGVSRSCAVAPDPAADVPPAQL